MDFDDVSEEQGFLAAIRRTWVAQEGEDKNELSHEEAVTLTRSPHINELISLGMSLRAGRGDAALFKSRLDTEILRFYEIYKKFLQVFSQADLSREVTIQAKLVLLSFQEYTTALDELRESFLSGSTELLLSGLKRAANAINSVSHTYETFVTGQSEALTKKCPKCGHANAIGVIECCGCQTFFTLASEEISLQFTALRFMQQPSPLFFGAASFPASFIEIYDNYLKYAVAAIDRDSYIESIDWIVLQLEVALLYFEKEQHIHQHDIHNTIQTLLEGLEMLKSGIEKIRDAAVIDRIESLEHEWNELIAAIYFIHRWQGNTGA
ncbi:MAG: hypothetical protein AB2L14_13320 [Candidatus Xenobiia bacterium LiM19]